MYVVDSSDRKRIVEAYEELGFILEVGCCCCWCLTAGLLLLDCWAAAAAAASFPEKRYQPGRLWPLHRASHSRCPLPAASCPPLLAQAHLSSLVRYW